MKKLLLCTVALFFTLLSVKAQLGNHKWAGTLQLDQLVDVVLDFRKDTLDAISTGEGRIIETMVYTVKGNLLTLNKVAGQSDCGDVAGKYKFEIKGDTLSITLVEDSCMNRSQVLDKTSWKKEK